MNENVKNMILELCSFLLDEDLLDDGNIEKILERTLASLEDSVFFRQEPWEKEIGKSNVH